MRDYFTHSGYAISTLDVRDYFTHTLPIETAQATN
jgi:hypothetical protein